ncbi:MAG TPA: hypothetical protein VIR27_17755 [Mycobacteriales bacterium]
MTELPDAQRWQAPVRDAPWAAPDPHPYGRSAPGSVPSPPPDQAAPAEPDGRGGTVVTPGSVPLRPLELGDILDGTFATIRRNPRATLGLSALLVTGQELLTLAAQVATGELPTVTLGGVDDDLVTPGLGTLAGYVISAVVGAVLTGMIVVVVGEDVLGRRTTAGQVWRRIRPRIGALLVGAVLAGALPYLGLALLVGPGVLLWGFWALATPALILEDLGPFRAVRRSWRLVRRSFWRVWAIRALSVLLGNVMALLVAVPFALVASLVMALTGAPPGYLVAIVALGSIVAGTLVEPFYAGVLALLYVDRRMRVEGFDIVVSLGNRDTARRAVVVAPVPPPGGAR